MVVDAVRRSLDEVDLTEQVLDLDNNRLVDDISSIESGDDLLKAEAMGMELDEEASHDEENGTNKKKKKKEKKKHKTKKGKKKKTKHKEKKKEKDKTTESDVLSVLIDL